MTEQQRYEVLRSGKDYELRRYPPCVVAEVEVDGDFEQAGSRAFRPLVEYIGGANRSRESVAMTAPVVQSQKMAMTAPVIQAAGGDAASDAGGDAPDYVVAFVLPASVSLDTAPVPTDPRVRVKEMPPSLTAVARYSGRWSQAAYEQQLIDLQAALAADGLVPVGPPRFARFDPPFKPWFLRRNEVHLDVREVT